MLVLEKEPVSVRQLNPNLPRDIETIVSKSLEKEPSSRYSSAEKLAEELKRFLNGEPIAARPISTVARMWRWCQRKPVTATLAAVAMFSLIFGFCSSAWFGIQATREKKIAQRELLRSERLLYGMQVQSAAREWDLGDAKAALQYFESTTPELRGWEYNWLQSRATRGQVTLVKEGGFGLHAAYSPDGSRIVTANRNKIAIWDAVSRQPILKFSPFSEPFEKTLMCIAWSPDGRLLASCDDDIWVWDAHTGRLCNTLTLPEQLRSLRYVQFSPTGRYLLAVPHASRNGTAIRVWDVTSGEEIRSFDVAAMANTDKRIVAMFRPDSDSVVIWERTSGELWEQPLTSEEPIHKTKIPTTAMVASDDGLRLAYRRDLNSAIAVWDVANQRDAVVLNGSEAQRPLSFSADGGRLLSSKGGIIHVWDLATGTPSVTLQGHTDGVGFAAFTPDGNEIISVGEKVVKIWQVTEPQIPRVVKSGGAVWSPCFANGNEIVCGFGLNGDVLVMDADIGQVKVQLPGPSPESDAVQIWGAGGPAQRVTCSRNGKLIAGANSLGNVRIWDRSSATAIADLQHELLDVYEQSPFYGTMLLSPDSSSLIRGNLWYDIQSSDTTRPVWRVGHKEYGGDQTHVLLHTFSPDGQYVVGVYGDILEGLVAKWSVNTRSSVWTSKLPGGAKNMTYNLAADRIAVAIANSNRVVVLDDEDGKEILDFVAHSSNVNAVRFLPDGNRIVTGSDDGTIRLWDAMGIEIMALRGNGDPIRSLDVSPDGKRIAACTVGSLEMWE